MSAQERVEVIQPLLLKGESYTQIGRVLGVSRNAVISFCYRIMLNHDNAPHFVLTDKRRPNRYERGPRKRPSRAKDGPDMRYAAQRKHKLPNNATDPLTRDVMAAVNASGKSDKAIAEVAGVGHSQFPLWRSGRARIRPYAAEAVLEAVRRLSET